MESRCYRQEHAKYRRIQVLHRFVWVRGVLRFLDGIIHLRASQSEDFDWTH